MDLGSCSARLHDGSWNVFGRCQLLKRGVAGVEKRITATQPSLYFFSPSQLSKLISPPHRVVVHRIAPTECATLIFLQHPISRHDYRSRVRSTITSMASLANPTCLKVFQATRIFPEFRPAEDEICRICLNPYGHGHRAVRVHFGACLHSFGRACLDGWLESGAP